MSGPNIGHGHVKPRADGVKARCGGPAFCSVCAKEQAALLAATTAPPLMVVEPTGEVRALVPEGWKLVPLKPTREQLQAAHDGPLGGEGDRDMDAATETWLTEMYEAYLAAAPVPNTTKDPQA